MSSPLQPPRILGPFSATSIVIGAIVGVGIFFGPSQMARLTQSGPLLLIAWGIGGAIALCGALVFAELGSRYTGNGAQYQVLRDAFGPMPAFLYVFCNATAIQAGAIGVIATVCTQNLYTAAGSAPPSGYALLAISAGLIFLVTLANIAGVRWGSGIQNFTVISKLAAIGVIIALAATQGKHAITEPPPPSSTPPPAAIAAVLAALIPAMFSYGGWQHSLWITGEVKDAQRNLPRAVIGGVLIVVIVYLLVNWAYLRLLGVGGVAASNALGADAVSSIWPGFGKRAMAAAIGVSAFGVLNAQLLSGPRLVYGMARDGRFFAPFARLSRGTPVAAILLMAAISLVLLCISSIVNIESKTKLDVIGMLGTGAVFIDCVFFILTGVALFRLRRGAAPGTFRAPGYPILPALFVLGEAGALIGAYMDRETARVAWIGVAWIVAAAALYLARFRSR